MEQGASGAAAGAAAASVAAGESSARFRGWVGEDSGQRTERTGPLTREQLWKLVDAVAVPGGVEREDGDIRAPAARFAAAVCGGGRGSESAYTRLAQKRKTANVADDYATVKGYICANCMKLASHDLALRPSGSLETVMMAGEKVQSYPAGCDPSDLHVVYSQQHKEELIAAGFVECRVHYYKPTLSLPEGFNRTDVGSSGKKGKKAAPTVTPVECEAPTATCATRNPVTDLVLPPKVPEWKSRQELFDMVEKPFLLKDVAGYSTGPFTPIYRWPSHKSTGKDSYWHSRRAVSALSHLFMDYYFLKVKPKDTLARVKASVDTSRRAKLKDTFTLSDPFAATPFPNVVSVWRNSKLPPQAKSWKDLVVSHLRQHLDDQFQEPFT